MEKTIELLAVADAYFGKPQTDESRKAISTVWAKSDLRTAPDDIAEQAFLRCHTALQVAEPAAS